MAKISKKLRIEWELGINRVRINRAQTCTLLLQYVIHQRVDVTGPETPRQTGTTARLSVSLRGETLPVMETLELWNFVLDNSATLG